MLSFITIPSATATIATTGVWSTAIFDELLPPALAVVGMFVGVAILILITRGIMDAINGLIDRGKDYTGLGESGHGKIVFRRSRGKLQEYIYDPEEED